MESEGHAVLVPGSGAVVELEQTLHVDEKAVGCVLALAASDDCLFAATQRGLISVWDKVLYQQRQKMVEVGDRCPLALAVLSVPQFGTLLLCAPRGCIELWDLQTLTLLGRVVGFAGNIFSLTHINDRFYAGCQDTTIKSIDVKRLLERLKSDGSGPATVTLAQLAAWDGILVTTSEHRGYVYALASTPRYLISGSGDGTVKVWDPETLKCVATLKGHTGSVLSVAADGSFIYSGSQDRLVKVWDLETFYQTRSLMHGAEVTAVAVSAGHLITGSADSTVKIWDKAQFACKQTIDHGAAVTYILVSGRTIFTACDNTIKVWTGEHQLSKRRSLAVSGGSIPLPNSTDLDDAMLEALRVFVRLRTISVDPAMKEQCWSGARFLRRLLREAGFECKLVQGAEGTNPLVLGRLGNDPSKPTLAYYGHYDVVPAALEEGWDSDPFVMDGRDGYLYGRGVTDDKGPIIAFVFAVKQLLANAAAEGATLHLPVNIVMAIEGEEENDSKGFIPAIENNLNWFEGTDVLLVSNGLWVGNRRPCLTYGLRGVVQLSLQITGAKKDLHSGIDGGLMHEPMVDLVSILGQLMDRSGTILPPHFYDAVQPLTAEEEKLYEGFETQFSSLTFFTDKYGVEKNEALLSSSPKDLLMRRWRQPSLTIHSISGSVLGKDAGATVIPHKVTAKLSVRIVPNQRPEEIFRMFASFLQDKFDALHSGNTLIVSKDHIGDWWLGNPFSEHYKAAERAIERVWGVRPSYIREGGTIPITRFLEDKLGASAVHLPLGQATDAAHLPNERIRLENLLKGKRVFQHFLTELAAARQQA